MKDRKMWRLVAFGLYFACLVHEVRTSLKPEFHNMLSKDERKRYLHADSQDTVPEYDITRVLSYRRKRSVLSPQQEFRLSAFGRNFELTLEPNDDLITDSVLPIERVTADGLLTKELHLPQERFYIGHVTSDPESHVAVREVNKKGQLSGAIMSDGHLYEIEPLPDHLHKRASLKGTGYHVISRRSIKDLTNNEVKSTPIGEIKEADDKLSEDQGEPDNATSKRDDVVYQGKIYIEAMLTADKTTCDFYGRGTLDYLLNTANLISRLFKDQSIGMQLSWVLVKVVLVEGFDADLNFTTSNITSGGKYLRKFARWASARNKPVGEAEHYDQAALLTRRVCGLSSCYMDGLAYWNTPCHRKMGVSVNDASGLSAAYTVAHEMGHNFGLRHDTGDCAKGYIMQGSQASGSNAHHWSPCSRDKLREVFTSQTCFHNQPPKQLPSPTLLPGLTTDIDRQCQLAHGEDYRGCSSQKWSCGALYCQKGGTCYSRGAPVAEGTECGFRKWCRAGICTGVGASLPPPIDGGWGGWMSYGECTRTCGGGVKFRSRQCNNPEPQYFGKPCKGSSRGHFKLCNTQECEFDRFRHEQCEEYNSKTSKYRAHFLGGSSKCSLACVAGGRGYYFGHVKDGTRCEANHFVYDVCINGQCQVVGCDKKLRSRKVFDRCLNCGGDGGSCVLKYGTYTKDYKVYGAKNGDIMFTIPKGATNVRIEEMAKTYNFLSIVSNTTGKYYIPVPSWTGTHEGAGTSIYHYMKNYNDAELILIRGPTNEALDAMYVYSGFHGNPGISYVFYVPGVAKSTNFHWEAKNEGGCSATCAGGVQLIKVTCHRDDDKTEVTPGYCNKRTKPAVSKPCNHVPCPKEFSVDVWSPCSEHCGGGVQHRNLTCVQVVSKDVTNILPEWECAHLTRPASTQKCNNIDCIQEWIVGEWTQCSVPCGNGTKTRSVDCKKKLADGNWTVLPDDQCYNKPPSIISCNVMPCYAWRVEYPCASCGGLDKTYVPIGCFRDEQHPAGRPLPEMVGNHRNGINWHQMSETVKKCADDTWQKQFAVFGVQFYGECWSGASGHITYDKDGFNLIGCWEGVGKTHNNYVYAFTSLVSQPLVDCIYTVNNQTVNDDKCSSEKPLVNMKLCSQVCKMGNAE